MNAWKEKALSIHNSFMTNSVAIIERRFYEKNGATEKIY